MPAFLTASDIADLIKDTQADLGRMKWTEIATDLQEHIAMNNLLRKERVGFSSGQSIQWNVMTTHSGAAAMVGLHQVIPVNIGDVMQQATIPWRHTNTHYAMERREILMNRSPARIVELIETRRADAMISLAELIETQFWSKPSSSSDKQNVFGTPYWIVKNASTGFNGGNPSGFTAGAGGIDSATYTRWANYTAQYSAITKADLIAKMKTASRKTNFKSPVRVPSFNTGDRYSYMTTEAVISGMDALAEAQNDRLGSDLASMDGELLFKKVPVRYVPFLDADTQNPVYGINWGVFKIVFLEGDYLYEHDPIQRENQPSTFINHVDLTWNVICRDRRRNFVIATA